MSALTDAMTAALATLQNDLHAGNGAVTVQDIVGQVHGVVDPQIATLTAMVAAIGASQADDEAKLADLTAAVTQFTAAFAPATTPTVTAPTASAPAVDLTASIDSTDVAAIGADA